MKRRYGWLGCVYIGLNGQRHTPVFFAKRHNVHVVYFTSHFRERLQGREWPGYVFIGLNRLRPALYILCKGTISIHFVSYLRKRDWEGMARLCLDMYRHITKRHQAFVVYKEAISYHLRFKRDGWLGCA